MKVIRDHDKLYLKANYKKNPKETSKFLARQAGPFLNRHPKPRVLDVGCATGDLLHYFGTLFPHAELFGFDFLKKLLDRAKKEVKNAQFFQIDITKRSTLPRSKYDAIFMVGVHSIFDDYKSWLDNLLWLLNDGGTIFVMGTFNPEPVDVLIKTRDVSQFEPDSWQSGWNLFSIKTISRHLDRRKAQYQFIPFELPIDIKKNLKDPLRSWTEKLENGKRMVINGTQLRHTVYVLKISKRKI